MLTSYVIGSGIGREIALTFAPRGANTLVCTDINLEAARETAEISQTRKAESCEGFEAHALKLDTRDEASVQHMVDKTTSLFGRIDYFVSTAGVSS